MKKQDEKRDKKIQAIKEFILSREKEKGLAVAAIGKFLGISKLSQKLKGTVDGHATPAKLNDADIAKLEPFIEAFSKDGKFDFKPIPTAKV